MVRIELHYPGELRVAAQHELSGEKLHTATAEVLKHMSQDLPRRVAQLDVSIQVPHRLTERELTILRNAAETCPVAKSIHPDLVVNLTLTCL